MAPELAITHQPHPVSVIMSAPSPSDAPPKQKRARTSRPKVRTGCNNCKRRRIKCDEKRPACTRCERSRRECSGYPPPPRSARAFDIPIAPAPPASIAVRQPIQVIQAIQPTASRPLPPRRVAKNHQRRMLSPDQEQQQRQQQHLQEQQQQQPPFQSPISTSTSITLYRPSFAPFAHQEGLYFELFRSQTANELSGYFDSVFWSRLVLQECHSEATIRHAVVALGALYKTLEKQTESPPSSPSAVASPTDSAFDHWVVALKSYSSALQSLVHETMRNDSTAYRTRLMASILLACFDSFVGDHKQAIMQIQSGLRLLEEVRAQRRRAFMSNPEEPVEDEIIQMFTRLAIQAKSYDMAFHFPKPYVIQLIQPATDASSPQSDSSSPISLHQDPFPDQFYSLHEARATWDMLCERVFRFTEMLFATASRNGPMGILPATLRKYGPRFGMQIEAWSKAFEHILANRSAPRVSSQEKAAIAALKMSQLMGQILFTMTFSESEGHFDSFNSHFKTIVDLGREVVGDEERRAAERRCPDPRQCHHYHDFEADIFGGDEYMASHIKPSFSADMGIVPPLYVVATKCRNPVIRRQAIQLLKSSSRREAMWDSNLSARIGSWIMDIEEEEDLSTFTPAPSSYGSFSDANGLSPQTAYTNDSSPRPQSGYSNGSIEFGDNLGPGGNAKWNLRRESTISMASKIQHKVVPSEKRVMVRAIEFDLREHKAHIQCGSRGLPVAGRDYKTREADITW